MKINKYKLLLRTLYLVSIITWFIIDYIGTINDDLKYIVIIFSTFIIFFENKKNCASVENGRNLKRIISMAIVLVIISYFLQLREFSFSLLPLKDAFYLVVPAIYAYTLLLCADNKDKEYFFNVIFYASLMTFLFLAKSKLNLTNILSISFINSYSPFEGIGMADIFLLLFCWYIIKDDKIKTIISATICFLSFKRFHLIFMVIYFILYIIENKKNKMQVNKINKYFKHIFWIMPILIILFFNEKFLEYFYKNFGIDFDTFSMGRYTLTQILLSGIENGTYVNLGLGSVGQYISAKTVGFVDNVHCDVLRIATETTYFGYILMTNTYFKITENKFYATLIMIFMFITMTLSHILTSFIGWFIFYLFIFSEVGETSEKK